MMMAQMRNVEPRADLPVVHMHKQTNAMPTRNPRPGQPRNLTGLYLGADRNDQSSNKIISPLTRTRAMPSRRVKTPTEQRRYKKVEMLRIKEDRRGFSGNPVKQHQRVLSTEETERMEPHQARPNFWDITKQTNRQFTSANNSGVSHLEYLCPDPDGSVSNFYPTAFDSALQDVLVHEMKTAVEKKKEVFGLIHCYNKICKGNRDTVLSLLPARRESPNRGRTTGFSVKSYRVPDQAELMYRFPTPEPRPHTVSHYQRPLVPSPYFFKNYIPPRAGVDLQGHREGSVVPAPGLGHFSGRQHQPQRSPHTRQTVPSPRSQNTEIKDAFPEVPTSTPTHRPSRDSTHNIDSAHNKNTAGKVEISLPVVFKQETNPPESPPINPQPITDSVTNPQPITDSVTNPQPITDSVTNPQPITDSVTDQGNPTDSPPSNVNDNVSVNKDSDDGPNDSSIQLPQEAPSIVIAPAEGTEDKQTADDGPRECIDTVMKSQDRREELSSLLNEHAEIIQHISIIQDDKTQEEQAEEQPKEEGQVEEQPKEEGQAEEQPKEEVKDDQDVSEINNPDKS